MANTFAALFAFFLVACQSSVQCARGTNEGCVVQQTCYGGPSPQTIEDLFNLITEMKTKMEFMEKKMVAFCNGECPLKQCKVNYFLLGAFFCHFTVESNAGAMPLEGRWSWGGGDLAWWGFITSLFHNCDDHSFYSFIDSQFNI